MAFPSEIPVKQIDRKGADWERYHYAWDLMNWLYIGGVEIQAVAEQFLQRRPKELSDVFQTRVQDFTYQNHAGSAIDWYQAALFERPPQVTATDEKALDQKTTDFYDAFSENCDRAYTSVTEHMRCFFKNLLLFGRAGTLVDLPKKGNFQNAAEEKAAGQFDPYLVQLEPRQIINLSRDEQGILNWIKFSMRTVEQGDGISEAPKVMDRWYYFDRQNFAVYEREVPEKEEKPPQDSLATLANEGQHSMASVLQVPVNYVELPQGLWLMNRAFLVAKDHLNNDNVLKFALKMSALAMPVIETDGEFQLTLSEAGFIKLPAGSKYYWSEPTGQSFSHLADRNRTLVEEIFRSFYLVAQSRSVNATAAAASAVSKQQDMAPSKKVMNLFGDVIRSAYQRTFNMVSVARGDEVTWDVRGLEFPEDPPDSEIETVSTALALEIPSDKLEKELFKKVARAALPDANKKLIDEISKEIDSAPKRDEREAMQAEAKAKSLIQDRMLNTDFPRKSV